MSVRLREKKKKKTLQCGGICGSKHKRAHWTYARAQRCFWMTFCYKWPTRSCSASLSGLSRPVLLTVGSACVVVCLRTSSSSSVSCGTPLVLTRRDGGRNRREKLRFNRSTLSVDTIPGSVTFSTSESIYPFFWLGKHLPEFCHVSSELCFLSVVACAPQHCEVLVSMLISI